MGLEDPAHRRLRRDATGHPILTIGTSWESTHFSESRWRGSMESYPIDSNLSSPPSPVPAFRATCHPKRVVALTGTVAEGRTPLAD